jgi:SAM-dependent methyltransferase
MVNIREYNRMAWDKSVESGNQWTIPVDAATVARARAGEWGIVLTPTKPVPRSWFPDLVDADVLCLASGGGQQGPIMAAAGARVVVLDNSPRQLAQDRMVAERDGLAIVTVEGDMADLHMFPDERFDLIVHPVSNTFVPDVRPVWAEAYRVLRHGGALLAGFTKPEVYLFDDDVVMRTGEMRVTHKLPYADVQDLSPEALQRRMDEGWPLEYSHTLQDQIGGQIDTGFVIAGFFEDTWNPADADPISQYMATFIATRAIKL